jgi:polysaccharide biosynthesis/export protein
VVSILKEYGPRTLSATFGDPRPPPEVRFGIGDVVSVSIFEAAAGGLFIPSEAGVRPGNFVTLPNQPVDTKGRISVPYAGAVPTAGKTPTEVQQEIVARIKNRAIEPQAVVALVTPNSSLITVIGEVNNTIISPTGRIPAQPSGERILDVITRAGGLRDQGQDTWVVLERHGRRSSVPFGSLIYEPGNNIWAWPGDTIFLYKEPQTFLAFGATGLQGQFQFSSGTQFGQPPASQWRVTLAEAIGLSGGLIDVTADPGSVFLYRREPRELAEKLGVDCSKMDGPTVPIVYSVSFVDPAGYFLATQVQMHNKDVVFAANAQSVGIEKFTTLLNNVISVPTQAALGATAVRALRQPQP